MKTETIRRPPAIEMRWIERKLSLSGSVSINGISTVSIKTISATVRNKIYQQLSAQTISVTVSKNCQQIYWIVKTANRYSQAINR